jgi:hypothetical protein
MLIEVNFFSSLCKNCAKTLSMEDPVEGCYVVIMYV